MAVRFWAAAPSVKELPSHALPEIAFAGRSNVGKSSLLGYVLGAPKLVRVSRTPGQTRTINLFEMNDAWILADLPGYGYAKTSKAMRSAMGRALSGYFSHREELRAVVLLVDARRDKVSPDDIEVLEGLTEAGMAVLLVLTKIDAVPKNRRRARVAEIERALGVPSGASIATSAKNREGRKALLSHFRELCT